MNPPCDPWSELTRIRVNSDHGYPVHFCLVHHLLHRSWDRPIAGPHRGVLGLSDSVAETFFTSLKNEMYHHQVFTTRAWTTAPQPRPGPTMKTAPRRHQPKRPNQKNHNELSKNLDTAQTPDAMMVSECCKTLKISRRSNRHTG